MTPELTDRQLTEQAIKERLPDGDRVVSISALNLTDEEFRDLASYVLEGRNVNLALQTAQKFFELFMNGCDANEIHRLNPTFPKGLIQLTRVRYNWDQMYRDAMLTMSSRVMNKISKAAVEATSIYTDMIAVANKQHGDSLKKYLQTGDAEYLKSAITINSIKDLATVIDSLQKLTGQDRTFTIEDKRENKATIINATPKPALSSGEMSSTQQVLNILAEEKRKKARGD